MIAGRLWGWLWLDGSKNSRKPCLLWDNFSFRSRSSLRGSTTRTKRSIENWRSKWTELWGPLKSRCPSIWGVLHSLNIDSYGLWIMLSIKGSLGKYIWVPDRIWTLQPSDRKWCRLSLELHRLRWKSKGYDRWDALTIELLGLRWQSKSYDKWDTLTIELYGLRWQSKGCDKWDTNYWATWTQMAEQKLR